MQSLFMNICKGRKKFKIEGKREINIEFLIKIQISSLIIYL